MRNKTLLKRASFFLFSLILSLVDSLCVSSGLHVCVGLFESMSWVMPPPDSTSFEDFGTLFQETTFHLSNAAQGTVAVLEDAIVPAAADDLLAIGISESFAGFLGGLASRSAARLIGDTNVQSNPTETATGSYFGGRKIATRAGDQSACRQLLHQIINFVISENMIKLSIVVISDDIIKLHIFLSVIILVLMPSLCSLTVHVSAATVAGLPRPLAILVGSISGSLLSESTIAISRKISQLQAGRGRRPSSPLTQRMRGAKKKRTQADSAMGNATSFPLARRREESEMQRGWGWGSGPRTGRRFLANEEAVTNTSPIQAVIRQLEYGDDAGSRRSPSTAFHGAAKVEVSPHTVTADANSSSPLLSWREIAEDVSKWVRTRPSFSFPFPSPLIDALVARWPMIYCCHLGGTRCSPCRCCSVGQWQVQTNLSTTHASTRSFFSFITVVA